MVYSDMVLYPVNHGNNDRLTNPDPEPQVQVNLDALARYTRQRGGWALSSPYMEGFKCQALAFGMGENLLEETCLAFEGVTQEFGPESFSTLQRAIKDEVRYCREPCVYLFITSSRPRLRRCGPCFVFDTRTTARSCRGSLRSPVRHDLHQESCFRSCLSIELKICSETY